MENSQEKKFSGKTTSKAKGDGGGRNGNKAKGGKEIVDLHLPKDVDTRVGKPLL